MGQGPDPAAAHSPAQFVELMRQLRRWADLSYRQLERHATDVGDVLPRATISAALSRDELPRAELLAAYIRACGGDEDSVTAWLNARRRLSISGSTTSTTPPLNPAGEDTQRTPADKNDDTQQKTVRVPGESAADQQVPGADPASEPTPHKAAAPADDTTRPANTASKRPRRGQLTAITAIAACTVAGVLALVALWPSDDGSDDHAGRAPQSARPGNPTATGTASRQPPAPATERRTATAGPTLSPTVSPAEQEKTAAPRPNRSSESGSARLPAAGWTLMHPAASASLCLTEGRERNGRTNREIAVQHPCANAPLPRVYLEKLSGPTYRIQWHNPDPGKGIGCLAVDGASAAPGALIAPRDCADSNSQKFRLEPADSGFRLRPLHSGLCVGLLPPLTDGAEAIQTDCTTDTSQAFTFTRT
ncbi:RICIN domain-containing protein [Streptomyces sp. TLI_146]|uniref:RICIN domain-containing protein n=1 Tax=Streptomyces sp. TLI_146 TaxID=1938858 RepID=UPI000CACBEE5|nr:RICIN domain-containing protein [Streptomyces sp. TLI_146]PKV82978.1 ricin-type beta-trefoil lectin protein [Streptomyces sp. TLI_146]